MDIVDWNHTTPNTIKLPMTSATSGLMQKVTEKLFCLTTQIVNVCFIGDPTKAHGWVLIDTGMPGKSDMITEALMKQFGESNPPSAILLTHGHFDHVGGAFDLAQNWDVPIYIHPDELPYVTGEKAYPKPDATVEGGLVAKLSRFFPNEPIQLDDYVKPLPDKLDFAGLENEWTWLHVPGHSPGQVAFFRERDKALLSADAIITVKQDELFDVITQNQQIQGPPRYWTTDWTAAHRSVQKLRSLDPAVLVPGHGLPLFGQELRDSLAVLDQQFERIAVPDYGKYVQ